MAELIPRPSIYELKEEAKWSENKKDKKAAIKELPSFGNDAIPALEEIFMVTISDDIRVACVDAINSIKGEIVPSVPEKAAEA